jgi:hypothetical protein
VEDRISGLKDKIDIKKKIQEFLEDLRAAKGISRTLQHHQKSKPASHGH